MNVETLIPVPVIANIEQATQTWLTAVLRESFLGKNDYVVRSKAVQIAIGEGFSGRLYRLSLTFDKAAPSSVIVKLATDDAQLKAITAPDNLYREARFYEQLAPVSGIDTPKVYYVSYGDGELVIIMEDLGDLELGSSGLTATPRQTTKAFSAIAKFHTRWWNHEILDEDWLKPAGDTLEKEELTRALNASLEKYGEQFPYLGKCMETFLKYLPKMPMVMTKKPPLTLIHGDFHRKNIHFRNNGSPLIFDWQVVETNKPVTDIANWLLMYLSTEDRRAHEVKLLRHYYKSLGRKCRRGYSFRKLKADYREALVPAIVRMLLLYEVIDLDTTKGQDLVALHLGRIEKTAQDHKALTMFKSMWILIWIARFQNRGNKKRRAQ